MKLQTTPFTAGLAVTLVLAFSLTTHFGIAAVAGTGTNTAQSANLTTLILDQNVGKIAAFNSWASRYVTSSNAAARSQMVAEGVALAGQRRDALHQLMASDSRRAIQSSIRANVREQLPAAVKDKLETMISGIGDFHVTCSLASKDGVPGEQIQRWVRINGKTYRAYAYGRRAHQATKYGIPLFGVAVGRDLVLDESPLRELASDDSADANGQGSPQTSAAEIAGKIYRFKSREQMKLTQHALEAAEEGPGPNPTASIAAAIESENLSGTEFRSVSTPVAASPYTEGKKSVLIIRVDFPDITGDPAWGTYTKDYVQNVSDTQITPFYQQSSYGMTDLTNIVTPLFRMPRTGADYATNAGSWQLHLDAVAAASASYNVDSYDRVMVVFSWLGSYLGSQITYGGMAELGGRRIWVNGEYDFRVVAHELGHTYGLWHGNLWQVTDGNPASDGGQNVEYGDDFDTMGANYANDPRTDFNPWFKSQLNWIGSNQVRTITSNGIYRIQRFDDAASSGLLALKVVKDATRNYWIGCRRKFTSNAMMQNGAYVTWGHNQNQGSSLLDMTTPGNNAQDAALGFGAIFTDSAAGITFRPVATGGAAPNEFIDIQIVFASLTRMEPIVSAQPQDQSVTSGQSASFNVQATGVPPPNYRWERKAAGSSTWKKLNESGTYLGTLSTTLQVVGVTPSMSGDLFRCVADNGVRPNATSNPAALTVFPPPPNDDFAHAILVSGVEAHVIGTNEYATQQVGEPYHANNPGGHSVWWRWVAPSGGQVKINTIGSSFDTLLAVYTGSEVSALSVVASDDDNGGSLCSAVAFEAEPGNTYSIAVDGFASAGVAGKTGTISLNLSLNPFPQIVSAPQDQRCFVGGTINFSVTAIGANPLSYQWRCNGMPIPAATNSTLTLANLQPEQAGLYSVVVGNAFYSVASSNATLTFSSVVGWGYNGEGEATVPIGISNTIAVAGGFMDTLALSADGTLTSWGRNSWEIPPDLAEVVAVRAGPYHSVALRANGRVVAWGDNYYGQATVTADLTNITAIAAGMMHNLALRNDGKVAVWGDSSLTQIPAGLSAVSAIAAGQSHSVVLQSDGRVVAWGDNAYGQCNVPSDLTNVVAIAAGRDFSLALRANGTVVLWGYGSPEDYWAVTNLTDVVAIAAGGEHGLALRRNGTLAAWGRNVDPRGGFSGQAIVPAGLSNVVAIAGGWYHSLAIVDSPPPTPRLFAPSKSGRCFTAILPTLHRKQYALEFKDSMAATNWITLPAIPGTGSRAVLTDFDASAPQRFYRVRQN